MAILPLLFLSFIPAASADSLEERALRLNEEMEYLMSVADKPRIWNEGSLPARAERSGPAPTQMERRTPGIENLENRFFSDEVSFQAAQASAPDEDNDSQFADEDLEAPTKPRRKLRRLDGTAP